MLRRDTGCRILQSSDETAQTDIDIVGAVKNVARMGCSTTKRRSSSLEGSCRGGMMDVDYKQKIGRLEED